MMTMEILIMRLKQIMKIEMIPKVRASDEIPDEYWIM